MPKLRRMRIVNLQYNKGNVLIPDEIWDFGEDSKSTLIHMENAGGNEGRNNLHHNGSGLGE